LTQPGESIAQPPIGSEGQTVDSKWSVALKSMAVLDIHLYGDPVLRRRASPVGDPTSLRKLAEDMLETMYAARGVGLAGPQVGRSLRLCVVLEIAEDHPETRAGEGEAAPAEGEQPEAAKESEIDECRPVVVRELAMINPLILDRTGSQLEPAEGCLSIPGVVGHVARAERVVVRYLDLDGRAQTLEAKGYLARVIQHEVDHLDGVLFIDRVEVGELAEQRETLAALQLETRLRMRELERSHRA